MKVVNYFKTKIMEYDYSSILLMLWLSEVFFMAVARFILVRFGLYDGIVRNTILFIVSSVPLILFLVQIKRFKLHQYKSSMILYLCIAVAFLLTIIIHPEYKYFFTRSRYGIERVLRPECALYAYLFFNLVDEPEKMMDIVKKYAILDFIYITIVELLPALLRGYWVDVNYLGEEVHRAYSLSFGYSMLLPVIVFLYVFIREKKIVYLLFGTVGGVLIFMKGSRGALVMIVNFLVLMYISSIVDCKDNKKRLVRIMIGVAVVLGMALFGRAILGVAADILQSCGIESRTLEMLVQGKFINDSSGRNVIWGAVANAIKDGGIFGYGVFGDRPFVYPHHYVGYSHNIVFEMIASFGILGVLILICIAAASFRMIFMCKDYLWRDLFIIFFSIACQLIFSMSFWYVMEFWAAAAIAHKYFQLSKMAKEDAAEEK